MSWRSKETIQSPSHWKSGFTDKEGKGQYWSPSGPCPPPLPVISEGCQSPTCVPGRVRYLRSGSGGKTFHHQTEPYSTRTWTVQVVCHFSLCRVRGFRGGFRSVSVPSSRPLVPPTRSKVVSATSTLTPPYPSLISRYLTPRPSPLPSSTQLKGEDGWRKK